MMKEREEKILIDDEMEGKKTTKNFWKKSGEDWGMMKDRKDKDFGWRERRRFWFDVER